MSEAAAGADLRLVRLLQLASPALPIGAFSSSQGLEWIVEQGGVSDAVSARAWIGDLLELIVARGEAAAAWHLLDAAHSAAWDLFAERNAWFRASRETAELRAESEQMGNALLKLAGDLDLLDEAAASRRETWGPVTLPAAFALTSRGLGIAAADALAAYVWSWLENQVIAAMKLIPLGQLAGQRLLLELGARLPAALEVARSTAADAVLSFAPGLALASARHETQYTRLFRS